MSANPPAEPGYFPIFLRVDGARVLVVGGGEEAASKARLLLGSRAEVVVVDPEPCGSLVELATVTLHRRDFSPQDLNGARLCIVALDDEAAAWRVAAAAREAGVPVNVVDRPAQCDFIVPAIVERAPVTVAIGTGGAAPALAREIRTRVEAAIPPGIGALAALCRSWRTRVADALRDRVARRRFWDDVVTGPEADAAVNGEAAQAEALLASRLRVARAGQSVAPQGRATLVGAGPGDPELMTMRAVRVLKSADVVLYDALIDPAILDLARRDARRIDVGKRCGRHAMSQAAINQLILRWAREGAHVVRLKGGDPFVFGRGGEEMDCLRAAGVPVEVIPGVTAACAAAARLGLPLTHRGIARSLHFVTGHGSDGAVPAHEWAALASAGGTIAAYMASRTIGVVAARLIASGLAAGTPAVAVENASRPDERRLFASLGELPAALSAQGFSGPTLVLIGAVVDLARTEAEQVARVA
jgi:uroporphyrin-III C-methyltransferase / precorrin-2 dehydrogenase / sirohydrochlorin ferrochelatase